MRLGSISFLFSRKKFSCGSTGDRFAFSSSFGGYAACFTFFFAPFMQPSKMLGISRGEWNAMSFLWPIRADRLPRILTFFIRHHYWHRPFPADRNGLSADRAWAR